MSAITKQCITLRAWAKQLRQYVGDPVLSVAVANDIDMAADTIASLSAKLAVSLETCCVECFDDGVDEGADGEWFYYAPPTWYLSCGHGVQGAERPNFCAVCGKRVSA